MLVTISGVALRPLSIKEEIAEIGESIENIKKLGRGIKGFFELINKVEYWTQPENIWAWLSASFASGVFEVPLLAFTLVSVMLWMLGAEKPKTWAYWANIVYWGLKLFVFIV